MLRGAILLALLLAACSGADERAPDPPPTEAVAAAPAPAPAPASAADSKKGRLEDMTYPDAREVILMLGWIPAGEDCGGGGTGETTCADFPEIDYCSGTGMGYCTMTFRRRDRCLDVLTTEGPPERGVTGTPYVKDVSFRKGPCLMEPRRG